MAFFLFCSICAAETNSNIEYILDSSNSMNEPLPTAELKIDAAKRILCNLVDNIASETPNANVGLRIYGASFAPDWTKIKACMDSILVVPIAKINAPLIKQKVMLAKAAGYTPIAYSLELASKDFTIGKENKNTIVLVSDGKETCDGDPVEVAKKLMEQGFGITIYTIGFDVDAEAREQLKQTAEVTGGKYYDAKNADQLQKSLEEIKDRSFEKYESAGEKTEPAKWISLAPEVSTGEYQWTIGMQKTQFYKIKAYKGQQVKATLIVKKTAYSAMNSIINQTFSVQLFNDSFDTVASEDSIVAGNPEEPVTFKAQCEADRTGWIYIAVSATNNHNEGGNPNSVYPEGAIPEPSSYTLKTKVKGDIPESEKDKVFDTVTATDKKGGTGFKNATEIALNTACNGIIYLKEIKFYKVPIQNVKTISAHAVVIKPWYAAYNSNINMDYIIKIYDEDWAEVKSEKIRISKNPAAPVSLTVTTEVQDNDEMYISLSTSSNISSQGADVGIYPDDFIPNPEPYSLLVTEKN